MTKFISLLIAVAIFFGWMVSDFSVGHYGFAVFDAVLAIGFAVLLIFHGVEYFEKERDKHGPN